MAEEGFLSPPDEQSLPLRPSSPAGNSGTAKTQTRAEIDTSAPFESVKEAANRFGGIGFWRPNSLKPTSQQPTFQQHDEDGDGVIDMTKMEERALLLEKDLIAKERETLDVLKELESTKNIVEDLKRKLQKETSEKENQNRHCHDPILCPSSAPGFILMELKQAKLNLSRTTTDLAHVRSIVETYHKKISDEKNLLQNARNRVSATATRISSMEEELTTTTKKLKHIQDSKNAIDLSDVLKQLNSEVEQYKKAGEFAQTQVLTTLSDIEHTKRKIETAQIRLYAAKKMKDAARASEASVMAEIKALSSSSTSPRLTLSRDEYMSLTSKAQESEESSKKRVRDAMLVVEKENLSQKLILKKIEEASEEAKSSKRVLEEALNRVESANMEKLAVEEALRKWRSDHSNNHRRRSVQNNTKFKNPSYYPSQNLRKEPRLLDVNGMNMVNDNEPRPVCRPIMSIGQILSRKLELDSNGEKNYVKRKVSLGQMLSKPASSDVLSSPMSGKENEPKQQQLPAKRKKFGFGRFSVLVRKQNKRKKMTSKL